MSINTIIKYIEQHSNQEIKFFKEDGSSLNCSYQKLQNDVESLCLRIQRSGLKKRAVIGLLGYSSYEWLVWDLAIISLDMVPLVLPETELSSSDNKLFEKYNLALLVTENHMVSSFDNSVVTLRAAVDELISIPPGNSRDICKNDDVLTYVFSSGTTGRLKGLIISKEGTVHILNQFIQAYKLTHQDCYFSFLSFSYYQQRALYLSALMVGAKIIVCHPEQLLSKIPEAKFTFTVAPPVFYESLYNLTRASNNIPKASLRSILGGSVRFMITAMAPIKKNVLDFYWEQGFQLQETYGVTETGLVTWNTLDDYKVGTVGKEAEPGTIELKEDGEVLIKRSKPLSLGYFDASTEESDEVFTKDGYVRTGDIAEVDQDGYYTIIGRKKHAILTQDGKKFHPEELESIFAQELYEISPEIDLVVVGGHDTCATTLVISSKDESSSEKVIPIISELNATLPSFKRIHRLLFTAREFSFENNFRTRNLKLDRKNITASLVTNGLGSDFIYV